MPSTRLRNFPYGHGDGAGVCLSADVAQLVEHSLGKGEVTGSIPVISSRFQGRFSKRSQAQVAEWLMAADCKSAALWSYGGSNPPLCTRVEGGEMRVSGARRKLVAIAFLAVLAALTWYTLDAGKIRLVVLILLGGFAFRIALTHRSEQDEHEAEERR